MHCNYDYIITDSNSVKSVKLTQFDKLLYNKFMFKYRYTVLLM
jgi:hypothetical protein